MIILNNKKIQTPSERIGQLCELLDYIRKHVSNAAGIDELKALAVEAGKAISDRNGINYSTVRSKHIAQLVNPGTMKRISTDCFFNLILSWIQGNGRNLREVLEYNAARGHETVDILLIRRTVI